MIKIRPFNSKDLDFIYATWLMSYRHNSFFAKKIVDDVFFIWHRKVIDRFLERGGTILVAHLEDDPNIIIGYLCKEPSDDIIQYAYVKKAFRKMGVGKQLFEASKASPSCIFTHWTKETGWILEKLPKIMYNPYLL